MWRPPLIPWPPPSKPTPDDPLPLSTLAVRAALAHSQLYALAYGQITPALNLVQVSPNFGDFLREGVTLALGQPVVETLWELAGLEADLYAVLNGQQPHLKLERVNVPQGALTRYLTLSVVPLWQTHPARGLMVLLTDTTTTTALERESLQMHLELRLTQQTLKQINHSLNQLAYIDSLTGLHNRRYLDTLPTLLAQAHPLSVIVGDLDFFKAINDQHGHMVGDLALRHVAAVLRHHARPQDVLVRFGGEEFVMILPQTDLPASQGLAETVRQALLAQPLQVDADTTLPLTISLGVAHSLNAPLFEVLRAADKALYSAKQAGRNCTRVVSLP